MKNKSEAIKAEPFGARIQEIDIIRGLALWGILLVNMGLFSFPEFYMNPSDFWKGHLNQLCIVLIQALGEGKFISVFSFLFGLGFSIFMKQAQMKTTHPKRLFFRRLVVLLVLGILHGYFIWYGDVLLMYSILGFLLMFFWNARPHQLLSWAFYLLIVPVTLFISGGLLFGATIYTDTPQEIIAAKESALKVINIYQNGNFYELVQQHLEDLTLTRLGYLSIVPQIFAMFLLGAYAGAKQFFDNLAKHESFIRNLQVGSLIIGLPICIASIRYLNYPIESLEFNITQMIGSYLAGPAMGLFYICSAILLLRKDRWKAKLKPFAAVGKMAATNYIMHSILCIYIFYSFGLGHYAKVSPPLGIVLASAIILTQILLSNLWLKYFKYGPVEWIWRYLTYFKRGS